MSDETRYSERDLVLAKREGARTVLRNGTAMSRQYIDEHVTRLFPLPKVTRARVVQDPHESQATWCVIRGELRWSICGDTGMIDLWGVGKLESRYSRATPERVRVWADLLANPTEEVDA